MEARLAMISALNLDSFPAQLRALVIGASGGIGAAFVRALRSEEHTSELQSRFDLVCRLLLEKKKTCRAPGCPLRRRPRLHSPRRSGSARTPSRRFFFFNDTATTEIYTLSLHDALPI